MDEHPPLVRIIMPDDLGDRCVPEQPLKLEPVLGVNADLCKHRVASWQPNICRLIFVVSHLVSAPSVTGGIDVGIGIGFACKSARAGQLARKITRGRTGQLPAPRALQSDRPSGPPSRRSPRPEAIELHCWLSRDEPPRRGLLSTHRFRESPLPPSFGCCGGIYRRHGAPIACRTISPAGSQGYR